MPEEQSAPSPTLGSATGSGEEAAPQGQAAAQPSGAQPDAGSPAQPATITRDLLLQSIPEEIRNEAVFQNINEENPVADLAGQFLHAQKLVGVDKMPAPNDKWTDTEWGQLYDRLGRPQSVDGYSLPEGSDTLGLDKEALDEFRNLAHQNGLTKKQFEQVMDFHNKVYGGQIEQAKAQQDQQIEQGLNQLRQEWGDSYEENLRQADRYFSQIKDESLRNLITENEVLRNHPGVIRHFHQLAKETQESAVRVGDTTNPSVIRSSEQAQAALKKFEMDNRELLLSRGENLSHDQRNRLNELLERRAELYKLAFPE